ILPGQATCGRLLVFERSFYVIIEIIKCYAAGKMEYLPGVAIKKKKNISYGDRINISVMIINPEFAELFKKKKKM
ncbi:hypothetical protein, partial [Enterobacter hormaechei]|uniref:hypothetical protein n=1 Tax=Enterobacter hormaechei TaxID=158836 RepID=UPI00265BF2F8